MAAVCVDIPKVRGKMAECGFNLTSMSNRLGINRNTLSAYLDTPSKMPYGIISDMASVLCETVEEATAIFFAPDLRNTKAPEGGPELNDRSCVS